MNILLYLYIVFIISLGSLGLLAEFIIPFFPPSEYYIWYISYVILMGVLVWKGNWCFNKLHKEDTTVYESDKYF